MGLDVGTGASGELASFESTDEISGEVTDGRPYAIVPYVSDPSDFSGSSGFGGEFTASSISSSFDFSTGFGNVAKSVEYPDEWDVFAEIGEPCVSVKLTFSSFSIFVSVLAVVTGSSAPGAFCC